MHSSSFANAVLPNDTDKPPERIYSEVYNSDAMLEQQRKIDNRPRIKDDPEDLEYVVCPIVLYSDSTHLTNFGHASLWPAYAWFASLTKYTCAKPSAYAAHHLAYIPTVRVSSPAPRHC